VLSWAVYVLVIVALLKQELNNHWVAIPVLCAQPHIMLIYVYSMVCFA